MKTARVVGCGKGVVYLKSPGCPTEIGLQLDKACYPCSNVLLRGNVLFFCFFTFIPVPLSYLSLSFISTISSISFLPFSGRPHKMTHKGWCVIKLQLNQSMKKALQYIYISHVKDFCNDLNFLAWQVWANSEDPGQTVPIGAVWSVVFADYQSIYIFSRISL